MLLQEATVNTNSFSVDQGRYAVAQVNYFTKSGSNAFHGDAYEIWNGSLFNAEDYFLHANDTADSIAKKPRSTVNEFGVSVADPFGETGYSSSGTTRAFALPCRSCHRSPCRRRLTSNMYWEHWPQAEQTRSPARLFRHSPQRFLSTKRCSLCYPHRAAPQCRLSGAHLVQTAMVAPASAKLH